MNIPLQSLVHVSTAYSNPYLRNVDEQVYGSTSDEDHQMFINGVGVLPDDFIDTIAKRFQKKHPNTYTLTKHMGEHIVRDYHKKLPICIVRPSIVTAAIDDPYPGWIDNIGGITGSYLLLSNQRHKISKFQSFTGVLMEIGRGTISSIRGRADNTCDIVPVDIACNTLITAAWANSFTKTSTTPVYNCTSGQINPLKWSELNEGIVKSSRKNPSKYVMMYPKYSYRTNGFVHWCYEIFLHFLPAIIFDLMLIIQRKRTFMLKLAKRVKLSHDTGSYFVMNEWNFDTKNYRRLMRAARETQTDAHEFNCDLSGLVWESYIEKYMMGIRTEILKDDISSLPKARKKLQRIIWTGRAFKLFLLVVVYLVFIHGF